MAISRDYSTDELSRSEVERFIGPTLLEFGNPWCGHCRRAEPLIAEAFEGYPNVRHLKIADARGRRLGRLFGVKLWPTLVFLKDGREVSRLVRPTQTDDIRSALAEIEGQ